MKPRYAVLLTIALTTTAMADPGRLTFYSDGALIELGAAASKGVIEIPLQEHFIEGSLKITPAPGTTIHKVDIIAGRVEGKSERELGSLTEQRQRLNDRLQALATREAIFTSAAKSQSGKSPRKTKTNPDPLQSIRQGTDFAIAQLEAVYTSRRRTEEEIRRVDGRIASLKRTSRIADKSVRINVTPSTGKIDLRYATTQQGWTPRYDIHLEEQGVARLQLIANVADLSGIKQVRVSPGGLTEYGNAPTYPAATGGTVNLATYRLPVSNLRVDDGIRPGFSALLMNMTGTTLPAGDASYFRNGSFYGHLRFEGISSGRSREVVSGAFAR